MLNAKVIEAAANVRVMDVEPISRSKEHPVRRVMTRRRVLLPHAMDDALASIAAWAPVPITASPQR